MPPTLSAVQWWESLEFQLNYYFYPIFILCSGFLRNVDFKDPQPLWWLASESHFGDDWNILLFPLSRACRWYYPSSPPHPMLLSLSLSLWWWWWWWWWGCKYCQCQLSVKNLLILFCEICVEFLLRRKTESDGWYARAGQDAKCAPPQ